jgi:hypothetical protein
LNLHIKALQLRHLRQIIEEWEITNNIVIVGLPHAGVKETRDGLLNPNPLRRFRGAALRRFHEFDLQGIEDLELSCLIVKHNHLAVRANHQLG